MSNYDARISQLNKDFRQLAVVNERLINITDNQNILHENLRKENKMLKEIIVNLSEKIGYNDNKIKKIKEEIIKDNFE